MIEADFVLRDRRVVHFRAVTPADEAELLQTSDGVDIVGSAIAVFASDRTTCEFAISVGAAFDGVGLANALMTALIDEADAAA